MYTSRKKTLVFLLATMLVFTWSVAPVLAGDKRYVPTKDRDALSMMYDVVILRPLGLVGTVVGTAFFFASLPFSILGGNTGEAAQKLVVEPAKYTFARPLGAESN